MDFISYRSDGDCQHDPTRASYLKERTKHWDRVSDRKALGIDRHEDLPELGQEEINALKRNIK